MSVAIRRGARVARLRPLRRASVLLLFAAAACGDSPTAPGTGPTKGKPPVEAPRPLGVYRIEVNGIGTDQMSSVVRAAAPATGSASASLTPLGSGIAIEQVSSLSFTEGTRTTGGQRYVSFTYRIRNGTGAPIGNLTMLLANRPNTIPGTAISSLRRFDGTAADTAIASRVVPTGAVALGRDLVNMRVVYGDVLQVYDESEVAAIALPGDLTGLLPYGYVVRRAGSTSTRALPAATDPNQYDGVLTVAFRLPLQATSAQDVFSLFFEILAVDDGTVRLTESMEEQGSDGMAQLAATAAALQPTQVTVLAGSTSTGYAGQRQICSVRTAGIPAAPMRLITAPGAYSRIALYRAGESVDACAPDFRTGTPSHTGVGLSVPITARAMDRYGNVRVVVDSIALTSTDAGMTTTPRAALVGGAATFGVTFSDYGSPLVTATGRRLQGAATVPVVPVTRIWTGAASTVWSTGANWNVGVAPASLDTAVVPTGPPAQPSLTAAASVGTLSVANGATVALGTYRLTANGSVTTGQTLGGVTSTTGQLRLAGTGQVAGRLPEVVVTGTYTASGDLLLRSPAQVDLGGGLENVGWLTEVRHY